MNNDRLIGRHDTEVRGMGTLGLDPIRAYTIDEVGEIRVWDLSEGQPKHKVISAQDSRVPRYPDPTLRWAVSGVRSEGQAHIWNLDAWPQARPLLLRRSGNWHIARFAFSPSGDWIVVSRPNAGRLTFWPLRGAWPRVVEGYETLFRPIAFSPDGRWLATDWGNSTIRLWPMPGNEIGEVRSLDLPAGIALSLSFDPQGRFLFVTHNEGSHVLPVDGSPPRRVSGPPQEDLAATAVSPSGRMVASAFGGGAGPTLVRVWNLETGREHRFEIPETGSEFMLHEAILDLAFASESKLYASGDRGVRLWDVPTGTHQVVFETPPNMGTRMTLAPGGRTALLQRFRGELDPVGDALVLDLESGETESRLPGSGLMAIHTSGTVAAIADKDDNIRVGRIVEGLPHLLVGHEGKIVSLDISPDGRWVASASQDGTLRLWPMPDLDKPPLHTLPHDELIAKLKALTNIRVVRDPESEQGWKVELDEFPGWAEVPEW